MLILGGIFFYLVASINAGYRDDFATIRSFHSTHNVVDRGVLQVMWEEVAGKIVRRDQLII